MWSLIKLSLKSFFHINTFVILLIHFLTGIIMNFYYPAADYLDKINLDRSCFIIAAYHFLIPFIFTVMWILSLDSRKINFLSLPHIKKELLNSFLLCSIPTGLLLIIFVMIAKYLLGTEFYNEISNFPYSTSMTDIIINVAYVIIPSSIIIWILDIYCSIAINYTLLDKTGIKDSLVRGRSIIKGYIFMLLFLTFFTFILFALLIAINSINKNEIESISNICVRQITTSFFSLYNISFFYHFWKKRKAEEAGF